MKKKLINRSLLPLTLIADYIRMLPAGMTLIEATGEVLENKEILRLYKRNKTSILALAESSGQLTDMLIKHKLLFKDPIKSLLELNPKYIVECSELAVTKLVIKLSLNPLIYNKSVYYEE